MVSTALWLTLLAAPSLGEVKLERLPLLPGKADLAVWRQLWRAPVFGGVAPTIWVRAAGPEATAALAALGWPAEPELWTPVRLDAAGLQVAVDALGLELRAAPAHRVLLDLSRVESGVERVHLGSGVEAARRGRGTLVGVIDTGIDLSHPAFRDRRGRSRVVAVWDQDAAEGQAPARFDYGHECRRQAIADDRCTLADAAGHGTHVAGIAAGADGVAPEALIAVVRSDTFTRIADAVAYLVALADELDLPLVINTSIGGHYGAHDGRTPIEQYLGRVLGRGRLLVAAAGNDGDTGLHLGSTLDAVPQRVALAGLPWSRPVELTVELWARPKARVEVAVELWRGGQLVAATDLVAPDSELIEAELSDGAGFAVALAYSIELDQTHRQERRTLLVDLGACRAPTADAFIALRLTGAGRVDGWLHQSDYRYGLVRFADAPFDGWLAGDGLRSIVVPATSADVITVGAYTTRTEWLAENREPYGLADTARGVLALFSSRGPTTAPQLTGTKPDLAAPGSVVASARAASIPPGPNTLDAERMVMQGTSMAAPHVTGAVALMLEVDRELEPAQARDQLTRAARSDANTGAVPNPAWGYGKLDAAAAVGLAEREARGCAATASGWALVAVLLLLRRRW